jgi:hypothetical protein
MKNILFILAITIFTSACSAQAVAPQAVVDMSKVHNDTYIVCKSKLDNSEIDYLKSGRTDYPSVTFQNFTVSNVVDIYGKHWSVNQTEWLNYICASKVLP